MSANFSWCASGSRLFTRWDHEGLRIIERYVTLCHHLTGHWRSCCQDPQPPSLTPISPTSHVFLGVGEAHLALFVCCNVCHVQDVAAARCLSWHGTVPPVLRAVTMQSQPCVCIGLMILVLGNSGWCCRVVLCYVYRRSLSFLQVAVRCERGKERVYVCAWCVMGAWCIQEALCSFAQPLETTGAQRSPLPGVYCVVLKFKPVLWHLPRELCSS